MAAATVEGKMDTQRSSIETVLRELPLTADWPQSVISHVAAIAIQVIYPAAAVVFREGDQNENTHFVLHGRVALEMSIPARGPVRLLTLSRGELLGWSPLVGNREMTATAIALEETQLLQISGPKLVSLCQLNHEVGFEVMRRVAWALSRRLTVTRLQLLDLFSHSAPEFVAAAAGGGPP